MSVYNILPEENLRMQDVRDTLNANGGTTDNSLSSYFKEAANINKWARYKPEDYDKMFDLTEADRIFNDYGLYLSGAYSYISPKELFERLASGEDFYRHILPTGGEDSPYRIGDFRGYDPAAPAPYTTDCVTSIQTQTYPVSAEFTVAKTYSETSVPLETCATFDRMHLAVMFTNESSYYLINPVEQSSEELDTALTFYKAGTEKAVAVFTNFESEGLTDISNMAEAWYPVPDSFRTITITTKVVYADADVLWVYGGSNDSLYYEANNRSISGFNMPYITLSFPDGSTPSFEYMLGLYVRVEMDGSIHEGYWYYEDQYITHEGGNTTARDTILDLFPAVLYLSEILGDLYDENMEVTYVSIRPMVEKVSGQGYLRVSNESDNEQILYEA